MSKTNMSVAAANVQVHDDIHIEGPTGWRTVKAIEPVPYRNAVQVTVNGRTEDNPLVQFFGKGEAVTILRPDAATFRYMERKRIIRLAAAVDIELSDEDFTVIDGDLYLDGMDPAEWLDAQTME